MSHWPGHFHGEWSLCVSSKAGLWVDLLSLGDGHPQTPRSILPKNKACEPARPTDPPSSADLTKGTHGAHSEACVLSGCPGDLGGAAPGRLDP